MAKRLLVSKAQVKIGIFECDGLKSTRLVDMVLVVSIASLGSLVLHGRLSRPSHQLIVLNSMKGKTVMRREIGRGSWQVND